MNIDDQMIQQMWETAHSEDSLGNDYWCDKKNSDNCQILESWILKANKIQLLTLTQNTPHSYNYDVLWVIFFNNNRLEELKEL